MTTDRVLNYWQAIEYLQPASAPKNDPHNRCWTVRAEHDLPWFNARRRGQCTISPADKFRWEFVIHAGLLDMKRLAQGLSEWLDVAQPDPERDQASEPAAVLALQVDFNGIVSSRPALSSLPWAASRIAAAAGGGALDFEGFSGEEGFEQGTVRCLADLLDERQCGPAEPAAPDESQEPAVPQQQQLGGAGAIPAGSPQAQRAPTTWQDIQALLELALRDTDCVRPFLLGGEVRVQAVRVSLKREGNEREPQALLNSFLAPDLLAVRQAWSRDDVGAGLRSYLAPEDGTGRIDVVRQGGGAIVRDATQPAHLPSGRWPSKHPLVLAQQFAVNKVRSELLGAPGLFSVNGPPGTGKTTLLRDVVALLVVERAKALAALPRAENGFGTQQPVRGDKPGQMHQVAEALQGFGMVVACLGNGAAQNVTRELPAAKSVDAPGVALDYFAAVAETVLAGPRDQHRQPGTAWGLIAAVLGNAELRGHFVNRFWFADAGAHARRERSAAADDAFVSFQTVLRQGVPEARDWREQRKIFRKALRRAEEATRVRQQLAEAIESLEDLEGAAAAADAAHEQARQAFDGQILALEAATALVADAHEACAAATTRHEQARELKGAIEHSMRYIAELPAGTSPAPKPQWSEQRVRRCHEDLQTLATIRARAVDDVDQRRPGALARFFNTRGFRAWCAERARAVEERTAAELLALRFGRWADEWPQLQARLDRAQAALGVAAHELEGFTSRTHADEAERAGQRLTACSADAARIESDVALAQRRLQDLACEAATARQRRDDARELIARSGIDESTREGWSWRDREDSEHQKQAPWSDAALEQARHEVFVEALELHKAFIAANAHKLRANLGLWVDLVQGKLSPAHLEPGAARHLWESLFLCVPVVSTAFASVATLFRGMGRESLGWVFIDEAGQATPQAAVGAIWRARRTLVVGDPLQLEPVVTLPARVVDALEDRLALPPHWNPRVASAQVLADRANRYGAFIDDAWVGCPLRVHRRCIEPMFSVANAISYDKLMVYGTGLSGAEQGREWLGPSCWIDVPSRGGDGHRIAAQEAVAIDVLQWVLALPHVGGQLFDAEGRAHVYLIAPFKAAAAGAREALQAMGLRDAAKVCGTIHTFQGKEADTVILLLGGDLHRPGAISGFAAGKPNLLNVALTRAKRRLYVVGQHDQWSGHRYFSRLAAELEVVSPPQFFGGQNRPASGYSERMPVGV